MHTKSDNIDLTMASETDETIKELFESLLQTYQEGLEELMRRGKFFLIVLMYWITFLMEHVEVAQFS